MIIPFANETSQRNLLREYAAMSEAWSRAEMRRFWDEQKAKDTPMWRAFGETLHADGPAGAA